MKSISVWRKTLYQSLQPKLADALLPWVNNLWDALGYSTELQDPTGTPQGFDGLRAKGSYEQLLVSEWALAQASPDEFLRRASMGEQLFYKPRFEAPQQSKATYILFDCGLFQLGYPRIVHLALVFVFLRRALRNNSIVRYGIWQDKQCTWHDLESTAAISSLLNKRSTTIPSEERTSQWQDAINDLGTDEVWWIGSPQFSVDHLEQVITIDPANSTEHIEVKIKTKSNAKTLQLPLLEKRHALQLLRDPWQFSEDRHLNSVNDLLPCHPQRLIFSHNGRKVVIQGRGDEYHIYSLPNSRKSKVGKPRTWQLPEDSKLVGMDVAKKSIRAMYRKGDEWHFHNTPNSPFEKFAAVQHIETADTQHIPPILFTINEAGKNAAYLVDGKNKLRHVYPSKQSLRIGTVADDVVGFGKTLNATYAGVWDRQQKTLDFRWYLESDSPSSKSFALGEAPPLLHVHGSGIWDKTHIGCLAYCEGGDRWYLYSTITWGNSIEWVIQHDKEHVVGVTVVGAQEAGLVSVYDQRIWLINKEGANDRIRLDRKPLKSWMNPVLPQVVTWDGCELQLHDLRKNETLWRLSAKESV